MRVLVTGGAGFIGSHLIDEVVRGGHAATCLDDFSTGRRENLAHLTARDDVTIVEGSILDEGLVRRLVAEHELVFHLAAAVGVGKIVADPLTSLKVNVRGTEHVLDACHDADKRVVIASSSEVYGKSSALPFREDGDRVLGPTTVARWSYATAKALDEHLALAHAERGLACSVVRYFNAYGPRMQPTGYGSVVARFIEQALRGDELTVHGDGGHTRCFTYVADTVRGTWLAGVLEAARGAVYNIGNDSELSVSELARLVCEVVGVQPRLRFLPYETVYGSGFEDPPRRAPSLERARHELGFAPTVGLREGIEQTVAWYRVSREERVLS